MVVNITPVTVIHIVENQYKINQKNIFFDIFDIFTHNFKMDSPQQAAIDQHIKDLRTLISTQPYILSFLEQPIPLDSYPIIIKKDPP